MQLMATKLKISDTINKVNRQAIDGDDKVVITDTEIFRKSIELLEIR